VNAITRLKAELLADRRKASILGMLLVAVIWLGGRAVFSGTGPRRASASESTSAASPAAHNPADLAAQAESRLRVIFRSWPVTDASAPATRDLFALNPAYFPHPAQPAPDESAAAKSSGQTDDETLARSAFAQDAASIRLKSILFGERPVAVLQTAGVAGGRDIMTRVGDVVAGFSVVRIERRRIVLERDGQRIELTVASPLD
jgi:hypothetical protein